MEMAGTEAFLHGLNPPLKSLRAVVTGKKTTLTPTPPAHSGHGVPAAGLKPRKVVFSII